MNKRKIILDCDPGHDDAIAMMLAFTNLKIDLLGITIVAGNQTLEKTLKNGLNVCQRLGIQTPVYAGMSKPLVRQQIVADDIHGETGLDGPVFEELKLKENDKHAVQYIIDTLLESDGDISLVPVGPLTNIATALRLEPRIKDKIQEIVLMGGAYGTGNTTPSAEFNIFADPEAAHIVFSSQVPIVMMGLDLTNQTVCTPSVITRMENIGNDAGQLFSDIMNFTLKTQYEAFGLRAGPIHDATCVAYLINPEIFTMKDMYVEVNTQEGNCYGRTVCDELNVLKKQTNAKVGITLDLEEFWNLVEECLRSFH